MLFQLKSGNGDIGIKVKQDVYDKNLERAKAGDPNAQFNIGYWEKRLDVSDGKENPVEWFLKAAIAGHPFAQYELGSSLVYGQGCKQDKAKGVEWLLRSASNGFSESKQLLAYVSSHKNTLESHRKTIEYLANEEELSASAQLNYAWMLATSPFEEIANPKKSIDIVETMSRKTFRDDITKYEIKAAAYAALGEFRTAVKLQRKALDRAKNREADDKVIKDRLSSYKQKKKWF